MVKSSASETLDRTFTALSDPTRRALLAAVADGPRTVGTLAAPLPMSLAAVSKHLSVLERAGLVTRTRSGRNQVCQLNAAPLRTAAAWLETYHRFWTTKLDALERYLTTEDE
jgi:DNA-binding transcriptional ArsR family regulator